MIKSLLDDEEPKEDAGEGGSGFLRRRKDKREFLSIDLSEDAAPEARPEETEDDLRSAIRGETPRHEERAPPIRLEIPPAAPPSPGIPGHSDDNTFSARTEVLERKLKEIEEELRREKERFSERSGDVSQSPAEPRGGSPMPGAPETPSAAVASREIRVPFGGDAKDDFIPESTAEVYRKSGLAWSAGIALFGSVVFMLVIGWFADLLFGSSPWGIVIGIVIGSAAGFLQFFRITSQILRPGKSDFEKVSLRSENSAPESEDPSSGSGTGIVG